MTMLEVQDLTVGFRLESRTVDAVKGVSFTVDRGETLALVGESGSGKSVTALSVLQLLPYPAASHPSGSIKFKGEELMGAPEPALRAIRGNRVGMIFQEPLTALNPLHTIEKQINEVLIVHRGLGRGAARQRTLELLELVGIRKAAKRLGAYPHELSGGQRQRVNIARALVLDPKLLVLDEPVSALDKSVQAQVLNLLQELKTERALTYVFISHDLNVIEYVSGRVLVMYLGQIVETGTADALADSPKHPYTQALFASAPSMDPDHRMARPPIAGDPPNPVNPPSGCRFRTRCAFAMPRCAEATPPPVAVGPDHDVACYLYQPEAAAAS